MSVSAYPPEHHVLRDLGFEIEVVGTNEQRAHLEGSDTASLGAVATVVDVLGGSLCLAVVAPDWMATSSLTLRCGELPGGSDMVMDARVLRAGRTAVTIEVGLSVGAPGTAARVVGDALLSFSRLERREANLDLSERTIDVGSRFGFERVVDGPAPPFDEAVGTVVVDATAGETETAVTPYVRNSFGAVNGGVVAAIAARAARVATSAATGAPEAATRVVDLVVHHLGQGRVGPVRTSTGVTVADGSRHLLRVEVHDVGLVDDQGAPRLMAVAHVGVSLDVASMIPTTQGERP